MRRHHCDSFRHIRCHVDLVVARVDEGVKYVPDLVMLQQERTERKAVYGANLDVRLATLGVSPMLHLAIHSQKSQAISQAMNYAASIVRLRARESLQMKDCFQPREVTKTGMLYPLSHAGLQRVMIPQVASLHWQQGGEGVVVSVS